VASRVVSDEAAADDPPEGSLSSSTGTFSALPPVRITARSMKFSSSLTFPGQFQAFKCVMAADGMDSIFFCICFAHFCTK
jgi:hypothetical protein